MRYCKVSLNSSLHISVTSWDLNRTVRHPPPSKGRSRFFLDFLPTLTFRELVYPFFLSTLLSFTASTPSSLEWHVR